jgi:hypothetical protein
LNSSLWGPQIPAAENFVARGEEPRVHVLECGEEEDGPVHLVDVWNTMQNPRNQRPPSRLREYKWVVFVALLAAIEWGFVKEVSLD